MEQIYNKNNTKENRSFTKVRTEQSVCSLRTVRWNRLARNRRKEKGREHPNVVAWEFETEEKKRTK